MARREIRHVAAWIAAALVHLDLPALSTLSITLTSLNRNSHDLQALLPHLSRHAYGPRDTEPLQSILLSSSNGPQILAWSVPDIDVEIQDPHTFLATTTIRLPRVALFFTNDEFFGFRIRRSFLDATLASLPLSGLVTLIAQDSSSMPPDKLFWPRHAANWPLLRRTRLEDCTQDEFKDMLNDNHSNRLLPALTELVLVGALSQDWAFALKRRAELGLPLERLDLRRCVPYSPEEVPLLSKISVDFLAPEDTAEMRERMISRWKTVICVSFISAEEINSACTAQYFSYTHDGTSDGSDAGVDSEDEDYEEFQDGDDVEVAEDYW